MGTAAGIISKTPGSRRWQLNLNQAFRVFTACANAESRSLSRPRHSPRALSRQHARRHAKDIVADGRPSARLCDAVSRSDD